MTHWQKITILFSLLICILIPSRVNAAEKNYITPVFPVRDRQYWRQGKEIKEIKRLSDLVIKYRLPSTWILHYDVLFDSEILTNLQITNHQLTEFGLFLEVTRKLAEDSFVKYDWEHGNWSQSNKVFLSGYTRDQRQRMIDKAFNTFKDNFGNYPKSYGAWYVDVWSMEYIRDKYGAEVVLGLADQYSTDGYQTWGQYVNLPYFVSKKMALEPAINEKDSTRILKLQWAPRHPLLSYGLSVDQSNYSAQVNDYHRQKSLEQDYFQKLLRDITVNVPGKISQAVIGIEAGELEEKYFTELEAQMKTLREWEEKGLIINVTMNRFNTQYRNLYRAVSPEHTITSTHSGTTVTWFMSPLMRYGIKETEEKKEYFDLRFYHASGYRDNDQLLPDPRPNLVRLVPAVIDDLVYGNATVSANLKPPETNSVQKGHSEYGVYSGKFPRLKSALVKSVSILPDFIYSKLDDQKYLGFRTGFETMVGIRLPKFKIGKFNFKFPILENFISIKKKFTPDLVWDGKQEIERESYKLSGKVIEKGLLYGQDNLFKDNGKIIFENSFYRIIEP